MKETNVAMENFKQHEIEWTDEKVSRLWNYYSVTPPYSEAYFAQKNGGALIKKLSLPTSQRLNVLDFGCGAGYLWDHVATIAPTWKYTGLDFSQRSVESLSERASGNANFKAAIHTQSLPSPCRESEFDIIFLIEVVEHLNDEYLTSTLDECFRVLKPGGKLCITTPNEEHLPDLKKFCPDCGCVFHEWQHVRSWSSKTLTETMQKHGLHHVTHQVQQFGPRANKIASWLRTLLGKDPGVLQTLVAIYEKPLTV